LYFIYVLFNYLYFANRKFFAYTLRSVICNPESLVVPIYNYVNSFLAIYYIIFLCVMLKYIYIFKITNDFCEIYEDITSICRYL